MRPNIRINFTIDRVPGRTLCTLKNVSKKFGDVKIIEHTNAEINRGDKIGLIVQTEKVNQLCYKLLQAPKPLKAKEYGAIMLIIHFMPSTSWML